MVCTSKLHSILQLTKLKTVVYIKHTSENAQTVDKNEVDFLVEKARTNAEWYSRRFIDFMSFNQATYPEYTNNVNDDIYPSYEATFNGWVLMSLQTKGKEH